MSEKLKLRLTVDVTYDLNGEDPGVLERHLENMVFRAIGDGMLTGASDAEVETHEIRIDEVPEMLDEKEIAQAIADRLESGAFLLEDMPLRAARYGLTDPIVFVNEMRERMELDD